MTSKEPNEMTALKTTARTTPFPHWHLMGLGSLALAALALPAAASADEKTPNLKAPASTWTLGLGVAHVPAYEGSDEYKTRALPLVSYRSGRFFAGALGGVGYNVSPVANFEFGPVLSYRFGRKESDSNRLRGLGDIDSGMDVGAFARWNLQPFFLHARLKQGVGGNVTGKQLSLGGGYAMALGAADSLVFDASVDWADKEVMQAHYGVTAAQAAGSGLAAYSASSGVRRYGIGALWSHSFTPQWFSTVGVGVYRLGDDAANSPITVKRNITQVSAGLGYRF